MPLARHDRDELDYFSNIPDFYSHASCEAWHTSICHLSVAVRFLLTCLLRGMTILIRCLKRTGKISTHMPLARHDKELWQFVKVLEISTHMPLARHDWRIYCGGLGQMISTHMPLARHDVRTIIIVAASMEFLLTCLLRGMTNPNLTAVRVCGYFYSHASCEAWHLWTRYDRRGKEFLLTCLLRGMTCRIRNHYRTSGFLLTCLLRGMTIESELRFCTFGHFYSHASCEAWLCAAVCRCWITAISTHMPLARHDLFSFTLPEIYWNFYSHASCEAWRGQGKIHWNLHNFYSHASCEAWRIKRIQADYADISTHMPLARHDYWNHKQRFWYKYFYSHASCEAWPTFFLRSSTFFFYFYSHASCEAWPHAVAKLPTIIAISTHMPLARHDKNVLRNLEYQCQFLLTCLLRGMTSFLTVPAFHFSISTHMPLARHDPCCGCTKGLCGISTHMPLARHDIISHVAVEITLLISTHMPLARHD